MRFTENIRAAFRVGLASARANLVPMVVLFGLAVVVSLGYFNVPEVSAALGPVVRWQDEYGWIAAFATCGVFCGLLPGVFVFLVRRLRVAHPWRTLLVQVGWSGICGIVSQVVFSLNAELFGTGTDLVTLGLKTLVFQFAWVPLFYAPVGALVYFWMGCDFSLIRFRRECTWRSWVAVLLPNLITNWVLWIPCSFAVHSFPTDLQIQLTGFANAFYSLLLIWIGRQSGVQRSRHSVGVMPVSRLK